MNDYYDNLMAYEYDDYVGEEEQFNEEAYEDYLIQKQMDEKAETFEATEYQSMMAEQMIDNLYSQNN